MDTARTGFLGLSHARLTAYGAVLLLFGAVAWNFNQQPVEIVSNTTPPQHEKSTGTDYLATLASNVSTTTPEGITPLGAAIVAQTILAYDQAKQAASSSDAGMAAVQDFGANINPGVTYRTYAASDVTTAPDTSKDRVLSYRADLRVALEPLLENKQYELDIFGNYVQTKNPKYLDDLRVAADNYRLAIANTEKVVAPADAAVYQASILTSMSKFASMLDALVGNATDPFASSALLHTFLDAQDGMLASFNSVAKYAAQKLL